MWDGSHVFLIATLAFTRLLLDEIYHLSELPFDWLIHDAMFVWLLDDLIRGFFTAIWHGKTPLQYKAIRQTKCASHPKPSMLACPRIWVSIWSYFIQLSKTLEMFASTWNLEWWKFSINQFVRICFELIHMIKLFLLCQCHTKENSCFYIYVIFTIARFLLILVTSI